MFGQWIWVCPKQQGDQCLSPKGDKPIWHGLCPNGGRRPDESKRPKPSYGATYEHVPNTLGTFKRKREEDEQSFSSLDLPPKKEQKEEGEIKPEDIYLNTLIHIEQLVGTMMQEQVKHSHLLRELAPLLGECRIHLAEMTKAIQLNKESS